MNARSNEQKNEKYVMNKIINTTKINNEIWEQKKLTEKKF